VILHLVTDRRQLAPSADDQIAFACLIEQARSAVSSGVGMIQVRERDLEARALTALVTSVMRVTRDSSTKVVVNERLDVALAAGADGVHLRGDSLHARHVRSMAPARFLIGRSVHSAAEAQAAGPVDYLVAGAVWATGSHPPDWPVLGVDGLQAIVRCAQVPVVAIGGVVPDRFPHIAAAGAAGVAGIGLFMGNAGSCRAQPLHAVAQRFLAAFAV
jgi:thiamine-phosphate pyrophosphorylase